jgi:hypothetical protein
MTEYSVQITPDGRDSRSSLLNVLGMIPEHSMGGDELAELDEAIKPAQKAVDSTPDGHSDCAGYLNNLGNKLESRYKQTGKMAI